MSNNTPKLDATQIQTYLKTLSNWVVNNGELQREFSLPSFPSAIFFVNAVAHLAELAAHHPDIHVLYNKVVLNIATHSAGGITETDFSFAQSVDELWHSFDVQPAM